MRSAGGEYVALCARASEVVEGNRARARWHILMAQRAAPDKSISHGT